MTVRAKFLIEKIECIHHPKGNRNGPDGNPDYKQPVVAEMRTVHMRPVYGSGDPNHENTKFWDASPGARTLWNRYSISRSA